MSYIPHFLVPWTQNITLGLDPTTLCSLPKNRSITECDFITRMVFKDVYWHYAFFHCYFMYLHAFFTCIVFYSPLFYHVHRVVTRLRFVNHY